MLARSLLLLAAATLSSAHFELLYPLTAGFVDDDEPTAPCGGQKVMVNSSSPHIEVDKFFVSIKSSHPAGTWGIRGTNSTQEPFTFVDIVPAIKTTGVGQFCLSDIRAPSDWAGKGGVLQIVDYSIDGTLYQCAPVNWVQGSNSTAGSACTNATGFSATWTTETSEQANQSVQSGSPSSSAAPSSTSHAAGAMITGAGSVLGLGLLAAGLVL